MKEAIRRLKDKLISRQQAYQQVFNRDNVFVRRVLEDLAKFCRANQTTFHTDPRLHAELEGRREVFLRIQQHVQLTPDELWKLYDGRGEP